MVKMSKSLKDSCIFPAFERLFIVGRKGKHNNHLERKFAELILQETHLAFRKRTKDIDTMKREIAAILLGNCDNEEVALMSDHDDPDFSENCVGEKTFTVEDAVESLGFGVFQLHLFIVTTYIR